MSSRFALLLVSRRSRCLLPLVLALLLLAAQAGTHAHLIGHVAELRHSGGAAHGEAHDDPAEHAADAGCLICLALAGIDLPPLAAGSALSSQVAPAVLFSATACPAGGSPALRPRCRAPPALFVSFA